MKEKNQTIVSSIGWHTRAATFTVVADSLKTLIGRDLFDRSNSIILTKR